MVFAGIVKEIFGVEIHFVEWMMIGFPFSVLMIAITWMVITRASFHVSKETTTKNTGIKEKLLSLGKMSVEEKQVLMVFAFTAFCWISRKYLLLQFIPNLNDTRPLQKGGERG